MKRGNKRGVSVVVGYVLLVIFVIIISTIVYQWLKTFVPSQPLECPEGTSIFIKESSFDSINSRLNITLRNNGRFNLAGFFIHGKNSSSQELAVIDLSIYLNDSFGGRLFGSSILFSSSPSNLFKPGSEADFVFEIPSEMGEITSVRITPTRFQQEDNRERFVSCGDARTEQLVGGPLIDCTPDCSGRVCGPDPVCGISCGTCSVDEFCDDAGQCILNTCEPASDPTLSGICGTQECGTATNGTCGEVTCGTCDSGFECNTTNQCESVCGDGIITIDEECDDSNTADGDGCSSSCVIESGWTCSGEPSICELIESCPDYCVSLGYSNGACTNSAGNCESDGGVYESGGDQWCTGGSQADTCCCTL